uniref:F-box domain protein n=1 Tax=Marseillevirus LCMAC102 TaxID=2506603 RepID=A0A481YV25_9VIRU|nr:MAG: F-box domain protein [Marseillevirus LCMAC102]
MVTFSNLPHDVISYLLFFLQRKDVISLGFVSKHFGQITKNRREEDKIKCQAAWKIVNWWRLKRSCSEFKNFYGIDFKNTDFDDINFDGANSDSCVESVQSQLSRMWTHCDSYDMLLRALSNIPDGAKLPADLLIVSIDTCERRIPGTKIIITKYVGTPGYICDLDKINHSAIFYGYGDPSLLILCSKQNGYLDHILNIPKRCLI